MGIENIAELIYNKVNSVVGAGNQLFTMCFPAQPLNYKQYQYDTSSSSSMLTKPYVISEAEFRLSDQLFDVSPITAGPNGENLSVVYNACINNLIPKLDYLVPFMRDRAGLGNFLEESSGETDENGKELSRIELCKKLYGEYLDKKNKWNETKNTKWNTLKKENLPDWQDAYAKWLSSEGMVEQEKLNNAHNDAVGRGKLHEVMTILGYLNSSSIAEELEVTKQRMRNSARSSMDESMTIYPVQFQPNNWFKALTPNINPADLTMAQDSIEDQLASKRRELVRAQAELARMNLMNVTQAEIDKAEAGVEAAKKALRLREDAILVGHSEALIGLARNIVKMLPKNALEDKSKVAGKAKVLGFVDDDAVLDSLSNICKGISQTQILQENLNDSLQQYQTLQARSAELNSKDWKFNKSTAEQRVQEITNEITYYERILAEVDGNTNKDKTQDDTSRLYSALYENGLIEAIERACATIDNDSVVVKTLNRNTMVPSKRISTVASKATGRRTAVPPAPEPADRTADSPAPADLTWDMLMKKWEDQAAKDPKTAGCSLKFLCEKCDEALTGKINETGNADGKIKLQGIQQRLQDAYRAVQQIVSSPLMPSIRSSGDPEIDGLFQEIVIKISSSQQAASNIAKSGSSAGSWSVSGWFASAGGAVNDASAESRQTSSFHSQDMEIGFRIAKVSFDRGGWFNPAIFKMSKSFSHLADMKVANGLTVDKVQAAKGSQTELLKLQQYQNSSGSMEKCILPAFPVAFVIAKDVTIKVKSESSSSNSMKSFVESSSASSGGICGFRASSSRANKSSSETSFHGQESDAYYIRIPGPQVLGYFLQFVPEDLSQDYKPNSDPVDPNKESAIIQAFHLYKSGKTKGNDKGQGTAAAQVAPANSH